MLTDYFDAYARRYRLYKDAVWCYEDGCIYRGLELLHRATGEDRWIDHLQRLIAAQLGEGPSLKGYEPSDYNIDNILPGRALLYLHATTGEDRWLDAAGLLADQLATHPRTRSGVYWHKLRYPWQVWLDGLYMGLPFQIGYGRTTGHDALVQDALAQLDTALAMTWEPRTGLYAHAVDEAKKQRWADPQTGRSRAHWARSLGWLAMALVDVADLVGADAFAPLAERTSGLFDRIVALRRPSGRWLQVIDRPDLAGNYDESSASAMFVYALLAAERLQLVSLGQDLMSPMVKGVIRKTDNGCEMADICEVAGLGMFANRYRDGSPEYYLTEVRVADDPKGVGPLMMGAAEAF